tara:strand:+ start:1828 stop:2253 length:426 start_codon:yes stop_codon:yes gene_type:complete
MKSGFNNLAEDNTDYIQNLSSIMVAFTENAVETASKYVKHCKRNHITSEDLKRGLMMELFVFSQRENLQTQVESIKKYLFEEESEDEEEDETIEVEDCDEFEESKCNCIMCQYINNIYTHWESYTPKSQIEEIIKTHINNI